MSKKPYPSEIQDRYIVRFPEGMRDRIAAIAKENGRSMNAEIIARIERSFSDEPLRAGALDLNGLLSAGLILSTDDNNNDPSIQFLITKAREAAQRVAGIAYRAEQDNPTVDGKK